MAALAARNEALMNGTPEPKAELTKLPKDDPSVGEFNALLAALPARKVGINGSGSGIPSYTHR